MGEERGGTLHRAEKGENVGKGSGRAVFEGVCVGECLKAWENGCCLKRAGARGMFERVEEWGMFERVGKGGNV